MVAFFPRLLLRERSNSWNLVGVAVSPGQTGQSVAPLVRTDGGGYWSCQMTDVSLSGGGSLRGKDRQKISTLLWRAVRQVCDGGVTPIVVPRNDALFRPWPEGLSTSDVIVSHDDGASFSDGSEYIQSAIDITCAAASLRDTTLEITILNASELQGGESFSICHPTMGWRLYEIATVEMDTDTTGTITFKPPLREDVATGTELEFDKPRCTMRLAAPSSMDLAVAPWTFNTASASFIETVAAS